MNDTRRFILELVAGIVGLLCLILAVFSSHWFFLPIVVILIGMAIVFHAPGLWPSRDGQSRFDESDIRSIVKRSGYRGGTGPR
jgi:hypothetical protein